MQQEHKQTYVVHDKITETTDTCTLQLVPCAETDTKDFLEYIPGQFITVYFPELGTPEGKAYSISSAPSEKKLSISVKSIGEFSRRLNTLNVGDVVTASLPYGYFYSESVDTVLVMIVAGIGIAPFRSMIVDALEKNPARKILLLYSVKTIADIVFKKEFDALHELHKNFTVTYFITRQKNIPHNMVHDRITAKKILESVGQTTDTEFLICGGISFTRDIWRDLRAVGVAEDSILTEAFFSH